MKKKNKKHLSQEAAAPLTEEEARKLTLQHAEGRLSDLLKSWYKNGVFDVQQQLIMSGVKLIRQRYFSAEFDSQGNLIARQERRASSAGGSEPEKIVALEKPLHIPPISLYFYKRNKTLNDKMLYTHVWTQDPDPNATSCPEFIPPLISAARGVDDVEWIGLLNNPELNPNPDPSPIRYLQMNSGAVLEPFSVQQRIEKFDAMVKRISTMKTLEDSKHPIADLLTNNLPDSLNLDAYKGITISPLAVAMAVTKKQALQLLKPPRGKNKQNRPCYTAETVFERPSVGKYGEYCHKLLDLGAWIDPRELPAEFFEVPLQGEKDPLLPLRNHYLAMCRRAEEVLDSNAHTAPLTVQDIRHLRGLNKLGALFERAETNPTLASQLLQLQPELPRWLGDDLAVNYQILGSVCHEAAPPSRPSWVATLMANAPRASAHRA
ncbi:MAG: hypothetical protein ACOYNL_10345 [Rickettsiales bacterium]